MKITPHGLIIHNLSHCLNGCPVFLYFHMNNSDNYSIQSLYDNTQFWQDNVEMIFLLENVNAYDPSGG